MNVFSMQLAVAAIGRKRIHRLIAKPASLIQLGRALPSQQWPDSRRIGTFLFKFARDIIQVLGKVVITTP